MGQQLVPAEAQALTQDERYRVIRAQMAEVCERLAGRNRQAALAFLERYERAVWAGVLLAAPDAATAKLGFEAAARAFLGDQQEAEA